MIFYSDNCVENRIKTNFPLYSYILFEDSQTPLTVIVSPITV